jgi:GDP-4-dehydro-6-deoxy-D-mannose reductase
MKKALITGVNGFVGPYLRKELEDNGYDVYGLDISKQGLNFFKCDITDAKSMQDVIKEVKPNFIFHLAGFSSVGKSFEQPELCFKINVDGTKNLLDAVKIIRDKELNPRILIVSSADVYGKPEYIPINENHPVNPVSPYGESRVEQERISLNSGLSVVISRSFNHTGEGQPDIFVIPSFKKQVALAKEGEKVLVGNLDIIRDFSDVRDVVRAYRLIIEKGDERGIYNVGSGKGYKLGDILDTFIKQSGKKLKIEIDEKKFREADIPTLVCDNRKVKQLGAEFREIFK